MGLVTVPKFVANKYIINDSEVSNNKDPPLITWKGLLNVPLIFKVTGTRSLEEK